MTKTNYLFTQQRLRSAWASYRLISLRRAIYGQLHTPTFFRQSTQTLISLVGCPGWSESSLGTQVIFFILSCFGSNMFSPFQEDICDPVRDFASLGDQTPLLAILDFPEQKVYINDDKDITTEVVKNFVKGYLDATLPSRPCRPWVLLDVCWNIIEPQHDKTNKMTYGPSEDSD